MAAVVAAVIFGGAGYAAGVEKGKKDPEPEPAARLGRATQVEKVEVEVAPRECVQALDLARDVFDVTGRFGDVMVDFLTAASEFDAERMAEETTKIDPLTAEIEELGPQFNEKAAICEEAS